MHLLMRSLKGPPSLFPVALLPSNHVPACNARKSKRPRPNEFHLYASAAAEVCRGGFGKAVLRRVYQSAGLVAALFPIQISPLDYGELWRRACRLCINE